MNYVGVRVKRVSTYTLYHCYTNWHVHKHKILSSVRAPELIKELLRECALFVTTYQLMLQCIQALIADSKLSHLLAVIISFV